MPLGKGGVEEIETESVSWQAAEVWKLRGQAREWWNIFVGSNEGVGAWGCVVKTRNKGNGLLEAIVTWMD